MPPRPPIFAADYWAWFRAAWRWLRGHPRAALATLALVPLLPVAGTASLWLPSSTVRVTMALPVQFLQPRPPRESPVPPPVAAPVSRAVGFAVSSALAWWPPAQLAEPDRQACELSAGHVAATVILVCRAAAGPAANAAADRALHAYWQELDRRTAELLQESRRDAEAVLREVGLAPDVSSLVGQARVRAAADNEAALAAAALQWRTASRQMAEQFAARSHDVIERSAPQQAVAAWLAGLAAAVAMLALVALIACDRAAD